MKLDDLNKLYIHELKDIYSAEKQMTDALPKMSRAATHPDLKSAFEDHLKETREHVKRIDRIFKNHPDFSPAGHKCKGMAGLIEEGADMISSEGADTVIDAGLIGAAQRVEHYEIAAYGTARSLAQQLGYDDDCAILTETIEEEGDADKLLTQIACSLVDEGELAGVSADSVRPSDD